MIKVLFFAHIQDTIGRESLILEESTLTIKELKVKLETYHHLHQLNNVMFAINEEYANDDDFIQDGDIVALIPPVSGG